VLDPVVGKDRIESHGFQAVDVADDLSDYAIAVLLTDHEVLDLGKIAREVPLILDTRGAYRRSGENREDIESL
jgi:UDP-N-acetyl-D-mannosaminuronate dehydrogenase